MEVDGVTGGGQLFHSEPPVVHNQLRMPPGNMWIPGDRQIAVGVPAQHVRALPVENLSPAPAGLQSVCNENEQAWAFETAAGRRIEGLSGSETIAATGRSHSTLLEIAASSTVTGGPEPRRAIVQLGRPTKYHNRPISPQAANSPHHPSFVRRVFMS